MVKKNNGNKSNGDRDRVNPLNLRGRDKLGLTAKQVESLPIIACAKTPYAGVQQCVELGIITSTGYFYRKWNKEVKYHEIMWRIRHEVQGSVLTATIDRFRMHAEDHADTVNFLAYKAESEAVRLQAARAALFAVGVETSGGGNINVSATATSQVENNQSEFCDRLADELQKGLDRLPTKE